jgi:hypothetical protein
MGVSRIARAWPPRVAVRARLPARPAGDVEFGERVREVGLDRALRDVQPLGDGVVAVSVGYAVLGRVSAPRPLSALRRGRAALASVLLAGDVGACLLVEPPTGEPEVRRDPHGLLVDDYMRLEHRIGHRG